MQKKKLFFAVILSCLVLLASAALYWYQKPLASLDNVKPAYTVSAQDLYAAFQQDEKKASQQFVEKIIQVEGSVDKVQVTDSTMSLLLSAGNEMGGINCSVVKTSMDKQALPAKGKVIQVKGRCIGFLMDVNLVDAVVEP